MCCECFVHELICILHKRAYGTFSFLGVGCNIFYPNPALLPKKQMPYVQLKYKSEKREDGREEIEAD